MRPRGRPKKLKRGRPSRSMVVSSGGAEPLSERGNGLYDIHISVEVPEHALPYVDYVGAYFTRERRCGCSRKSSVLNTPTMTFKLFAGRQMNLGQYSLLSVLVMLICVFVFLAIGSLLFVQLL